MISIVVLACFFLLLVCLCLCFSNMELLTPRFGFSLSFLPSTSLAILYVNDWSLDLAQGTFWTLLGGGILFFFVSTCVERIYDYIHPKEKKLLRMTDRNRVSLIQIENWKLLLCLLIQSLTLLLLIRYFFSFGIGQLSAAINYYRYTNLFTDEVIKLPSYINYLRIFSVSSGFVWTYILVNNIIYKNKKGRVLLFCNIILSVVNGLIMGGRTPAMVLLVAAGVQYYIIRQSKDKWKNTIRLKHVIKIILICFVVFLAFMQSLKLIGRAINYDVAEYLAHYMSTEIKNLDIFVREGHFGVGPERWQTLINVINHLSNRGILRGMYHELDIPFRYVNGHSLGNVATTYYSFLYDGGYGAVILFITLMAILSELIYKRALKKQSPRYSGINVPLIIYSYTFFTLLFSFFSNKFYEMLFSINFVRYLVVWYALAFFICKVKLKKTTKIN